MTRLANLDPADLTPAQQAVADRMAAGPRGGIVGPFNALLRSPQLCDPVQQTGAYLRFESDVPGDLRELAILCVARHWTAQYEWYAHSRIAATEGLPAPVIDAIAARQQPPFTNDDQRLVHTLATSLLTTGVVDDATYAAAIERFGERGVVDLVGTVGYYCIVSFTLNTFEVPLPPDAGPALSR